MDWKWIRKESGTSFFGSKFISDNPFFWPVPFKIKTVFFQNADRRLEVWISIGYNAVIPKAGKCPFPH